MTHRLTKTGEDRSRSSILASHMLQTKRRRRRAGDGQASSYVPGNRRCNFHAAGGSMKSKMLLLVPSLALGCALILPLCSDEPIIPPSVSKISPAGMQRGGTSTFTLEGRNLTDATEVIFDAPGISGKVTQVTDIPEQITGPRAGEDLEAQVPRGKKQTAELEIMVAKDALPGIHRFRIKTPLGTTN